MYYDLQDALRKKITDLGYYPEVEFKQVNFTTEMVKCVVNSGKGELELYVAQFSLLILSDTVVCSTAVDVRTEFRGLKVGQVLLKTRIEACKEVGFTKYIATVSESNLVEKHILNKFGFVKDNVSNLFTKDL